MTRIDLNFGRLASPPLVAYRLLEVTESNKINRQALIDNLSIGPVFAARIMKLANSPTYREESFVTTLPQAIFRIGVNATATLALSFNAPQNNPEMTQSGHFPFRTYWEHSYAMAVSCKLISKLAKQSFHERAFLCGLLAHLGQPIIASSSPAKYDQLINQSSGSLPSADQEYSLFQYDYRMAGSQVLFEWGLPKPIYMPIKHFGNPAAAKELDDRELYALCVIMQIADQIAANFSKYNQETLTDRIQAVFKSRWKIDIDQTRQFTADLFQQTARVFPLFEQETIDSEESNRIYTRAQKQVAIIATRSNTDLHQHSIQHNELEKAYVDLKTETVGMHHQAKKIRHGFQLLTHSALASSVITGLTLIVIFLIVYIVKSTLGINLLDNLHLEDLLFK